MHSALGARCVLIVNKKPKWKHKRHIYTTEIELNWTVQMERYVFRFIEC